jgi:hypothetical protein
MRCTVTSGSTMTLVPSLLVSTNGSVLLTCSAIRGDTLLLIPPVPSPITTMATSSPGSAAPLSMHHGRLVKNRITIPAM